MPTDPVTRTLVAAQATVRGALTGRPILGLLGAAAVFPVLVGGIWAAGPPKGTDLLSVAEVLFSALFLPVILLLVCLVQGAGLLRTELEEDTLLYPLKRTVPRASLVVGKYLGFLVATLAALLPSALLGIFLGVKGGNGTQSAGTGLFEATVLLTVLGVVAYGATFELLGLLTRSALVIGLVYGFLWETFLSQVAGPIQYYTVVYYLRSAGAALVPGGALGGSPAAGSIPGVAAGLAAYALLCLIAGSAVLRYTEVRASPAPP